MKSFLTIIIVLVIIGFLGYYAFSTLETGSEFAKRKKELALSQEDEDYTQADMEEEVGLLPSQTDADFTQTDAGEEPEEVDPEVEKIKADLQDLLDRGIILEPGDSGLLVLRIQKFLNYYDEDLNLSLDRDFGPSTRHAIENFQKENNLYVDGGVGPKTLQKMIDFLEK